MFSEDEYTYSYEEEVLSENKDDLSQIFHESQLQIKTQITDSPPPEINEEDPSLAFSTSIRKSKELLKEALGYNTNKMKYNHPHGLAILPLECFNSIRFYDNPPRKPIPHILYYPQDQETRLNHPEFQSCLAIFYPSEEDNS